MARRRRAGARIAAGIGEGLANLGPLMLRQTAQDRYDERAQKSQEAILDRQQQMQTRGAVLELLKGLGAGGDPEQTAAMIGMLTGEAPSPSQLESLRPSPYRRMAPTRKAVTDAKTLLDVPPDESIATEGRAAGLGMPQEWLIPGASMNDPFAEFGGDARGAAVREVGESAGARRRSFMDAPTETVTLQLPTGEEQTSMFSLSDLTKGVTTKPTAEDQGRIKGVAENAATEVTGPGRAAQVGREEQARQDVAMSPTAVAARTREAVNREVATLKATLPMQLELAIRKAAIEVQQATNKENAANVATSSRAAGQLGIFFNKVADLTKGLNDQDYGPSARVQGALATAGSFVGMEPRIQELQQLIAQNLRPLAMVMGVREANTSDKDTLQALRGIGVSQWSTTKERRNALRNLQDLITLGPEVAKRAAPDADIGTRMTLAQGLMRSRRAAEQEAIRAGVDLYFDPVTGAPTKVIQ